jgi:hypothetical protein
MPLYTAKIKNNFMAGLGFDGDGNLGGAGSEKWRLQ